MAAVTIPLHPDQLSFVVEVEVDNIPAVKGKLLQEKKQAPAPLRVKALVDTGASTCAATDRVIQALKLPSKNAVAGEIMTAGGPIKSLQYFAALHLTEAPEIRVGYATLCRYDFTNAPFELILRMSALSRWNFTYSRVEQKLTIEL